MSETRWKCVYCGELFDNEMIAAFHCVVTATRTKCWHCKKITMIDFDGVPDPEEDEFVGEYPTCSEWDSDQVWDEYQCGLCGSVYRDVVLAITCCAAAEKVEIVATETTDDV